MIILDFIGRETAIFTEFGTSCFLTSHCVFISILHCPKVVSVPKALPGTCKCRVNDVRTNKIDGWMDGWMDTLPLSGKPMGPEKVLVP